MCFLSKHVHQKAREKKNGKLFFYQCKQNYMNIKSTLYCTKNSYTYYLRKKNEFHIKNTLRVRSACASTQSISAGQLLSEPMHEKTNNLVL